MAKNKSEMLQLLEQVLLSVESIGSTNTTNLLKTGRAIVPDTTQKCIDFIFVKVCSTFKIPLKELRSGSSKTNRTEARNVCFYILRIHLKLTQRQISLLFDHVHQPHVSVGVKQISELDPKTKLPAERDLYSKFKKVENETIDFLKK